MTLFGVLQRRTLIRVAVVDPAIAFAVVQRSPPPPFPFACPPAEPAS